MNEPYDQGDEFDTPNLYDLSSVQDYDAALEAAARVRLTLSAEAADDARIYAVGEMGAIQVIGTGKPGGFPSNADQVLQGPCILVYRKDVDQRATELLAELSQPGE